MTTIQLTTRIEAPVERVFDLSRSIDLHLASTAHTGERAIAGITSGLIGLNEEVTWSARHFGIRFRMTVGITAYDRPHHFRDEMLRGPFRKMEHDHVFELQGSTTLMHDTFRFASPLGPFGGRLVDRALLKPHLLALLEERNGWIKRMAESEEGERFL
ncbi:SRPBCC family protein [Luteolibacter ambystomatis]|uniref:SRPBCC family protein n=1 Tax=Luteolibacter ambystomatis TaxID=2824561 RepID=A0A975G821_9BACT|nr:SRPBCC family protein [Luteolibacter ambystomatis]QUE50471.1 SRPBCC family protein [Luteolibacter ambystomatis]